jgi:hypothetical protein
MPIDTLNFLDEIMEGEMEDITELWRHKKRGTVYEVVGLAELQSSTGRPEDGSFLVLYKGEDGKLWAREQSEFQDGRFEILVG